MQALKALRKNYVKTSLIFLSMVVSIAAILLIRAVAEGVVGMYSTMLKSDGDLIVTQKGIADTFFSDINRSLMGPISTIRGVRAVHAMILGASPIDHLPIAAVYGASTPKSYHLIQGDYPHASEVMLGNKLYTLLHQPQSVVMASHRYEVSGVFQSKVGFEAGGVVMRIEDAQKLFHKSASILLIEIDPQTDQHTLIEAIATLDRSIEVKTTQNFIDNYNQFKIIQISSGVIGSLAFLMGLLGIVSMMSMVVSDRKGEFGIMRSLGLSSWVIIRRLMMETMILAWGAFVVAVAVAYGVLELLEHIEHFQGYIHGELTLSLLCQVLVASMVMALIGTLIPALYASRIDPMSLIQRGNG